MEIKIKDKVVLIDDADKEIYEENKFYINKNSKGYESVRIYKGKNAKKQFATVLFGEYDKKLEIDHINGNRLDNRRSNLRLCTHAENMRNIRIQKNNTSGYKGVSYYTKIKKWVASCEINGKRYKKQFNDKNDAARFYNEMSIKFYGEYGYINVIK